MNQIRKLAVVVVALGSISVAQADLIYDESVDGESDPWLSNGGEALGDVSSGDYILGSVASGITPVQWDGFNFVLDGSVNSIIIEASNWVEEIAGGQNGWQLYPCANGGCSALTSSHLSAEFFIISFDVFGLVGAYTLGNNSIVTDGGFVYDYQISFDRAAAQVPEPGTLALLGIGLFGMGLARRRKI